MKLLLCVNNGSYRGYISKQANTIQTHTHHLASSNVSQHSAQKQKEAETKEKKKRDGVVCVNAKAGTACSPQWIHQRLHTPVTASLLTKFPFPSPPLFSFLFFISLFPLCLQDAEPELYHHHHYNMFLFLFFHRELAKAFTEKKSVINFSEVERVIRKCMPYSPV